MYYSFVVCPTNKWEQMHAYNTYTCTLAHMWVHVFPNYLAVEAIVTVVAHKHMLHRIEASSGLNFWCYSASDKVLSLE